MIAGIRSGRRKQSVEPRNFVVVTTQGCGATWLMDRIDSLPGVQGHMELFYNDFRRAPARAGCNDYPRFIEIGKRFGHGRRPESLFGYLDQFYSRPGASGFKLMYSQLKEYPEILLYMAVHRLPVLHLVRNNLLDAVTEQELDRHMQLSVPIELDAAAVTARIKRLQRKQSIMRKLLKLLPLPLLELSYEDLRTEASAFESLCSFIGINPEHAVDCNCREPASPEPRRNLLISNYQELGAGLRRNGFGRFL